MLTDTIYLEIQLLVILVMQQLLAHHYDNGSESYRIRKAATSGFLGQTKQTQVQLVVVLHNNLRTYIVVYM